MLSIRDLVKVYPGPVAALQGVRLDIPQGMFGLLEPTSGTAELDGSEITSEPSRVQLRRKFALFKF